MTQNVVGFFFLVFFFHPCLPRSLPPPPLAGVHVFACLFDSAPGACVHWSAGPQLCTGLSVFAPAATPWPSAPISIPCELLTASVRSWRVVTHFDVAALRPALLPIPLVSPHLGKRLLSRRALKRQSHVHLRSRSPTAESSRLSLRGAVTSRGGLDGPDLRL